MGFAVCCSVTDEDNERLFKTSYLTVHTTFPLSKEKNIYYFRDLQKYNSCHTSWLHCQSWNFARR